MPILLDNISAVSLNIKFMCMNSSQRNTHDPKIPNLLFEAVNFPIVMLGGPFKKR
jgi:hypothetical protein